MPTIDGTPTPLEAAVAAVECRGCGDPLGTGGHQECGLDGRLDEHVMAVVDAITDMSPCFDHEDETMVDLAVREAQHIATVVIDPLVDRLQRKADEGGSE